MKITEQKKIEQKEPSPKLVFPKLVLGTIEKRDMERIYEWFSDEEFLRTYDYMPPVPYTKEQVDKLINDYENNVESCVLGIKLIDNSEVKIIGIAGFDDIVAENMVATLFIGIGDKNIRGKGYGKKSLNLLLEHGFNKLDFHRIQLNVLEFNKAGIALYEKAGFKNEGIFREFALRDGKRYDLWLYGLLKREWIENKA